MARKVLIDLVTRRLPAGAPVAFRVLGDGGARGAGGDPCGTSLAVLLSPLDPGALADRIASLDVVQETDTPIGAALREVAGDLADSSGTHVLVLITDGEETCGGDPPAAIRALKAKGIDARVNIVGLGLSDKRLKRSMQSWARLGNGTYFDARDSAQLARAIAGGACQTHGPLRRGRRRDGQGGLAGSAGTGAVAEPRWTALQSMLTLRRRPGPKWRNGRRCGLKHR